MSPVSRGRKTKTKAKTKKRAPGRPGAARPAVADSLAGAGSSGSAPLEPPEAPPRRPDWFDASIKSVLDRADVVMAAQGPRELEQAAAGLVGAELQLAMREVRRKLWFDWFFTELAEDAAARVRDESARPDGAWESSWRLLHGLTSIAPSALRSAATGALTRARKGLPAGAAARQPQWLRQLSQIAATGEVWEMHDAYGTRFAVIAGFCYPGGADPSVFLFDIDASGFVALASAGAFDDVEQAAAAWRAQVGETADGARRSEVEAAERLYCLAYLAADNGLPTGSESRAAMDNWFRARRRVDDLADTLRRRGMPLPAAKSLYHDIDTAPMAEAFTKWYARRHGAAPDAEVVDSVAQEWLEGMLPGTWHAVSPDRAQFQLALISDWMPGPVTEAAKRLLPEWVRWNGEQSGLPMHLIDRAIAAARMTVPRPTPRH